MRAWCRRGVSERVPTGAGVGAALDAGGSLAEIAEDLQRDLTRAIASSGLDSVRIGLSVVDLRSGAVLADVQAQQPLIPASNMKLLTSACAAKSLTPDFAFQTRFLLDGSTLYVVGSGDPGLGDPVLLEGLPEPMDVEALLDFFARTIAKAQPGAIERIVIDDSAFDRQRVHPSWPQDQLQYYYCAQVQGLNFHLNVVNVYATPTTVNQPARVVIEPAASGVEVVNTTTTAPRRTASGRVHSSIIHIRRDGPGNRLHVSGQVSRSQSAPAAVDDMALLFGQMLAERLDRLGVKVGQAHRLPGEAVERLGEGQSPTGTVVLVVRTPLEEVLKRCNTDSYNLHAEALFKALGRAVTGQPGSWTLGAATLRSILVESLGPAAIEGLRVADGSGMSRDNAIAPATITALLAHMNALSDRQARRIFFQSLARPGQGTLRRNFPTTGQLRTSLLAKTGYLNGVRAISGVMAPKDRPDEPVLAFSILMNGFDAGQSLRTRELRNELVTIIDAAAARRAGALVIQNEAP
ncbi:MAG: peptidase M15 [Phycisphaerales bacterium]|nr:MAG: peptidase M15 [Phycisphaerales bacterium]